MRFFGLQITKTKNVEQLCDQLQQLVTQLNTAFRTMKFEDNFTVYQWQGSIPATEELRIPHSLRRIPSGKVIVEHKGGLLADGDTRWTANEVYLKNISSTSAAEARVLFYV